MSTSLLISWSGIGKHRTTLLQIGSSQRIATAPARSGASNRFGCARSRAIQPTARKLGITKRIGWHTFRRTYSSILQDNGEDVKVVQELLRHASTKVTLDVYAPALTPTKRAAQRKVVQMIRGESPWTASVPREIGASV
jgi:integrase